MRACPVTLCAFAVLACGGRTILPADGASDAGRDAFSRLESGSPAASWDAPADSCSPDGVRLCGGRCGDAPGCPVCGNLLTDTGGASSYGVCWADLVDQGQTPCSLCDDGQGCVQRSPGLFVCVPLDVCHDLDTLGAGPICWYGDKVPFSGAAVPAASGCPDDSTDMVCGGDCSPCTYGSLARCVGRGPNHPFGVCPALDHVLSPTDISSFPTCALSAAGFMAAPCPTAPSNDTYACAVSPYPPGDETVARLNGFCLVLPTCAALARSLPGGLWCYDSSGTRVAP